jgi:alpha/beta superfamily hydrolase
MREMQTVSKLQPCEMEEAGYLPVLDSHVYTVLHQTVNAAARVLLVGPFASERQTSYLPWVKWARHLASRGIEVLRFDYRGVGESSGAFEEMTFHCWIEDVRMVAEWFQSRPPRMPFILHGLDIGCLFASQCFQEGLGDGLLLWSPPTSANHALRSTLLRWIGLQQMLMPRADRKKASDYLDQLALGHSIEVDGHVWSKQLWDDSFAWNLSETFRSFGEMTINHRPIRTVALPSNAAPLIKGGFAGRDEARDFEWLFSEYSAWILEKILSGGNNCGFVN